MGLGLDDPVHLAIVLVIVLFLFGAKKLPEVGRSLGLGMRGFKDSLTGRVDGSPSAIADPQTDTAHEARYHGSASSSQP